MRISLENFKYSVQNLAGLSLSNPHRDDHIEPCILWRGRLKEWRRPQIVFRRPDCLPSSDPRIHLWRAVPYTAICHKYDRAVIRAQRQADILLERSICTAEQKV